MSLHQGHQRFEQEVCRYLQERGYITEEAPYHAVFSQQAKELLQDRWSWTALYLRGRADRVAIHTELPIEFEFECKTHDTKDPKKQDMTIEAWPLVHHLFKSRLGVLCLYIYRNSHENHECGFWAHDPPPIRCIMVSRRAEYNLLRGPLISFFNAEFPGIPVPQINIYRGTGDPFLIVDKSVVENLPDWRTLVETITPNYQLPYLACERMLREVLSYREELIRRADRAGVSVPSLSSLDVDAILSHNVKLEEQILKAERRADQIVMQQSFLVPEVTRLNTNV